MQTIRVVENLNKIRVLYKYMVMVMSDGIGVKHYEKYLKPLKRICGDFKSLSRDLSARRWNNPASGQTRWLD